MVQALFTAKHVAALRANLKGPTQLMALGMLGAVGVAGIAKLVVQAASLFSNARVVRTAGAAGGQGTTSASRIVGTRSRGSGAGGAALAIAVAGAVLTLAVAVMAQHALNQPFLADLTLGRGPTEPDPGEKPPPPGAPVPTSGDEPRPDPEDDPEGTDPSRRPVCLQAPIIPSEQQIGHIHRRHFPGGSEVTPTAGLFYPDTDHDALLYLAAGVAPWEDSDGTCLRYVEAGVHIGIDGFTRQDTSVFTVRTTREGFLITMHPGRG